MKTIKLTKGQVALVDDEDYEKLSQWKWYAQYRKGTGCYYAIRSDYSGDSQKSVYMHRYILGLEAGEKKVINHKNHNTLDNRKENIEICSHKENIRFSRKKKSSTKGYKGIYRVNSSRKWTAQISVDGERIYLGVFSNEKDAALAYDWGAKKYFGKFAYVNFPEIKNPPEPISEARIKSSKFKGVSWHRVAKKWQAYIDINRKRKHLGLYSTEEEAYQAYLEAKKLQIKKGENK